MTENELYEKVISATVGELLESYPLVSDFFANLRIPALSPDETVPELIDRFDDVTAEEFGLNKRDLPLEISRFILGFHRETDEADVVESLTIYGGINKSGETENGVIHLLKGEVAAIVGPTGSGKSRLLADIECLAQRDTPTKRMILVNGKELTLEKRFDMDGKLVAQLSQNMNFIMDLSVRDFLEMHARSRFSKDIEWTVKQCLACANELAGEPFEDKTKVTQLSGGQSRALMIADTAYMSSSPLVLIDEIENAGIDRKKAVRVLTKSEKIVLIATHDPLLALSADKRLVIKNGGIVKVIKTTAEERAVLGEIEDMDSKLQNLRNALRAGEVIMTTDVKE